MEARNRLGEELNAIVQPIHLLPQMDNHIGRDRKQEGSIDGRRRAAFGIQPVVFFVRQGLRLAHGVEDQVNLVRLKLPPVAGKQVVWKSLVLSHGN